MYASFKNDGYTFEVPLLEGDFVSTEQGTGFVHVAPTEKMILN